MAAGQRSILLRVQWGARFFPDLRNWRLEAALTGTLEAYLYNDVEVAILGCRSTRHPAACSVGRPILFQTCGTGGWEAALTGTLEAYLYNRYQEKDCILTIRVSCSP